MNLIKNTLPLFPSSLDEVIRRIENVDPISYGRTRNYVDGKVTYLSPYISRGFTTTKRILDSVIRRGYKPAQIEKFIQELAWRDYWQQVWIAKGSEINTDIKNPQTPVNNYGMAEAIYKGATGILAIDLAIDDFYNTGYIHNHIRMYIASLSCNLAKNHWKLPAQWMYYHLLDADWASNALSWQWVAGSNSNKKYYANQENINRYCYTSQKSTFLDIPYQAFSGIETISILEPTITPIFTTSLPPAEDISIDRSLPACIYNFYNLDPAWRTEIKANRILLLEPSHFKNYPVAKKTIQFILKLAKENIDKVQVFVGEFQDLLATYSFNSLYFKEHPTTEHYEGIKEDREWMFPVKGYYPSFFSYWKKCKKQLSNL
ncbi:FAD-binding domain-containing protein [Eudoraea chungangensis]|uniref:FAD-binding domain-containing protein n=1 Tax=Eudoraea chungangensis TaxID=1481905 RepID=UPI0023EAE987|nr:FAD-binding domain-containing protein [Eudoraea chungangensis]